jgi:uncharacterized membrane protein YdjX (TVP38/TMEM64 family)
MAAPAPNPLSPDASHRSWLGRWLLLPLSLIAIITLYFLGLQDYLSWEQLRAHLDQLESQVQEHFLLTLLLYFSLYVTITALSLPLATGMTLIGGALFGRWLATVVIDLAASLGATFAFLSSRYLFRNLVEHRFGPRLEVLNNGLARDGAFYLFALRLTPIFPFFLINLGMGLTRLRAWTFFWVSYLGMLPATFLFANAGHEIRDIQSPRDILSVPVMLSLALLGLVPLILRKLIPLRSPTVEEMKEPHTQ